MLRNELIIDIGYAQPSPMAASKAGMRWLVVKADIILSYKYCGV